MDNIHNFSLDVFPLHAVHRAKFGWFFAKAGEGFKNAPRTLSLTSDNTTHFLGSLKNPDDNSRMEIIKMEKKLILTFKI